MSGDENLKTLNKLISNQKVDGGSKKEEYVQKTRSSFRKSESSSVENTSQPIIPKLGHYADCYNFIVKTIDELFHLRSSFPFREPVDPVELSVPDYPKIVKRPMDLGTISKNLKSNISNPYGCLKYPSITHLLKEIHLIFDNAYLFNKEGTMVYKSAVDLQMQFFRRLEKSGLFTEIDLAEAKKSTHEDIKEAGEGIGGGQVLLDHKIANKQDQMKKYEERERKREELWSSKKKENTPKNTTKNGKNEKKVEEELQKTKHLRSKGKEKETRTESETKTTTLKHRNKRARVEEDDYLEIQPGDRVELTIEEQKILMEKIQVISEKYPEELLRLINKISPEKLDGGDDDKEEMEFEIESFTPENQRRLFRFAERFKP